MHILLATLILALPALLSGAELHVSAPKIIRPAMLEITALFEKNNPEWKVNLRTGRSSDLGRMISKGTDTDVFLLSDEKTIKMLREKKHVRNIRKFLADDLIVIGGASSALEITDSSKLSFPDLKAVAMYPEKNPLGKRTRAYLKRINLLESLTPKLLEKKNTKEIINSIISGEATWAIVYASDVVDVTGVKRLWTIPEKEMAPNVIYIGSVTASENKSGARLYLEALTSTISLKIFENAGWRLIKQPAEK